MYNTQLGPPGSAELLEDVIKHITYKPGWRIELELRERNGEHLAGSWGLTLIISATQEDSTGALGVIGLGHFFAVPPASYNRETWERWILDCLIQVECHETMEWFKIDGRAPYFPAHGTQNGNNPYTIARRSCGDSLPGAPVW